MTLSPPILPKRYQTRRPLLLTVSIEFLAVCVLCVLLFPRSLLQEGNPLPVFQAIVHMELSGVGAVSLDAQQRQWLKRPDARAEQDGLTRVLAQQGWELSYREGMGRGYKNGERIWRMTCRMYTSSYEICEGDRSP